MAPAARSPSETAQGVSKEAQWSSPEALGFPSCGHCGVESTSVPKQMGNGEEEPEIGDDVEHS